MKPFLLFCLSLLLCSWSFGKQKFKIPKEYAYIPSGKITIAEEEAAIDAFYILNHEVTNAEYREFITDLKVNGLDSLYKIALPDSLAWNTPSTFNQPYREFYFSHPAYADYPVVNITPEATQLYCAWLSKKLRAKYGDFMNDVRIPTKEEWIYAARGGLKKSSYPWGGSYLRDSKGDFLANFKAIGDQNIRETENGFEIVPASKFQFSYENINHSDITAPSISYTANGYGLYNMSGNVSELTSDGKARGGSWASTGFDIRVLSEEEFFHANPHTGFRPVITFLAKEG